MLLNVLRLVLIKTHCGYSWEFLVEAIPVTSTGYILVQAEMYNEASKAGAINRIID